MWPGVACWITTRCWKHCRASGLRAIDVTEPEPLPRDHPLLAMENLIIAPHLGSATRQSRYNMARRTIDNLLAGLQGEALPSRVG